MIGPAAIVFRTMQDTAVGDAQEIVPGLIRLPLPLPFAAAWINAWAIEDGDGWALVDAGDYTEETQAAWRQFLRDALNDRPITRIILTHFHADHAGAAGWLCERTGAGVEMSRTEFLTMRLMVAEAADGAAAGFDFFRAIGFSDDQLRAYGSRYAAYLAAWHPPPQSFARLSDGDSIELGGHRWDVITGSGHCPEHVCLLDRARGLFISGDQVLPDISSNVSVQPGEPYANPLGEWIASLEKLERLVPDDVLVLPAHGEPFRGLHARLHSLRDRHVQSFSRVLDALAAPSTVFDLFPTLFRRPIVDGNRHLAAGETMAVLNYLIAQGEVRECEPQQGVRVFAKAASRM